MRLAIWLLAMLIGACGSDGNQGSTGERGEQGPQGEQGEPGETGAPGEPGLQGEQGELGQPGTRGGNGEQGLQGANGIDGDRGPQGVQGEQGAIGDAGPQGIPGVPGEMGLEGMMGMPGPAGRFALQDGNGEELGTLISAVIPDAWWVMTDTDTIVGYSYFGGAARTLGGGNSDLFYTSTDCTGDAYALIAVVGAGITNSGQLYRQYGPLMVGLTIHSLRPSSGSACTENITSTRNVMAIELVGTAPPDGVMPFQLVQRP